MRTRFPAALLTMIAVLGMLAWACPLAAAELLDEWTFDEGTGEVAQGKKGHPGKLTGVAWSEGAHGKALEFHGPDYSGPYKPPGSFVEITDSAALNPKKTVEVVASVYPTMNPVAWGGIVEKGAGYGASYRLMMLRNGRVRAAIGNEHITVESAEPLKLNTWTRLRLLFDGKSLKLFVNDKPAGVVPATPKSLASERPIEFGRRFTGRIDDVRISY